jgi:UDP-GlcNAc:undecaprenyl-phosphate GlcNAc-1-phosphate transferase
MKIILEIIISIATAFIWAIVFIPILAKVASMVGLVDKPNARKVHHNPTPLVGGIAIFFASYCALFLSYHFIKDLRLLLPVLVASFLLLLIGIIDDKTDMRASYKLLIQYACAHTVFASGICITSLHGVAGVENLPRNIQYGLTMLVIIGTINAFNLMDGIDGLLGGLVVICTAVLGLIAFWLQQYAWVVLHAGLLGAVLGYLRYNLSTKHKIFMGDAGSLFLGFLLVVSGIHLLQVADAEPQFLSPRWILGVLVSIFVVPILDSLRVYYGRVKRGTSPFKADKTHIHHLFLQLGYRHKTASLCIHSAVLGMLLLAFCLSWLMVTYVITLICLAFFALTTLLTSITTMLDWQEKLKNWEARKIFENKTNSYL